MKDNFGLGIAFAFMVITIIAWGLKVIPFGDFLIILAVLMVFIQGENK